MSTMNDKDKDKLLELLDGLSEFVHPSGRKKRSDIGKKHNYAPERKQRSDAGSKRGSYDKTPAFYKKIFQTFINAHTYTDSSGGDDLIRDYNGIFPPNTTNYYKTVRAASGHIYKSSVARKNHPEKLRWNWLMCAYEQAPDDLKFEWSKRITQLYFIKQEDILFWTYGEWAWAYVKEIGGHNNRYIPNQIILSYEAFLNGDYGHPSYNEKGEVVWET